MYGTGVRTKNRKLKAEGRRLKAKIWKEQY
jgi:hypothetical protein